VFAKVDDDALRAMHGSRACLDCSSGGLQARHGRLYRARRPCVVVTCINSPCVASGMFAKVAEKKWAWLFGVVVTCAVC
jgi:hypothetical protein